MHGKISMNKLTAVQLLAGGALLVLANLAQAQYVWIDQKGMKQFSDQAPPASVPLKNILKAPPKTAAFVAVDEFSTKPAAPAAAPAALADREADYRKRMKEKADVDTKAAGQADYVAQRKAACDAARIRIAELASGKRVRTNTEDRAVLDDNARAAKLAEANQSLSQCN
jgi:hypothetical protein